MEEWHIGNALELGTEAEHVNVDGSWHEPVSQEDIEIQSIMEQPSPIAVNHDGILSTHGVFGQQEIIDPDNFFHANIAESSRSLVNEQTSTLEQQTVMELPGTLAEPLTDASLQRLISQQNIIDIDDFSLYSNSPGLMELHIFVLNLWKQFEQFGGSGEFRQCQVKRKPPGFGSLDVQELEEIISQTGHPRFSWKKASFVIDHPPSVRNPVSGTDGVQVTFPGPKGATPSVASDGQVVWRVGGDKVPETSRVKPWRFWVGDDPKFYILIFVPFLHRRSTGAKRYRINVSGSNGAAKESSGDSADQFASIEDETDEFVEKMLQRMKSDGRLTEGAKGSPERIKQETNYRKSLKTTLLTLMLPFTSKGTDQRWADEVLKPNFGRLSLEQVFVHIDKYGHLPWIRSEKAIQETGVNLVEDHVDLLAAVEHLYLYFREWAENQSQPEAEQEQLRVVCGENMCSEARELSMLPDAERLPALRRKNREFISRVFAYSKLSPTRMCSSTGGARHDDCDRIAAVAKQIVKMVGGEDHDLKGISTQIRKLGVDWEEQAFMIAREAVNRCAEGLTSKKPCGKFWITLFHLVVALFLL